MPDLTTDSIPQGWRRARIAELVERVETTNPRDEPDKLFTYVEIGSIDSETKSVHSARSVQGALAPVRARQRISADDVLVSTVRPKLGTVALVPSISNGVATTAFCVLRAGGEVLARFLYYVVQSAGFRANLVALERGATYPAVGVRDVLSQFILLPPLADQERIVRQLDALLSELTTETGRLANEFENLAIEREDLVRSAVTGQIQDWTELPPGSDANLPSKHTGRPEGVSNKLRGDRVRPSDGMLSESARAYRAIDGSPISLPASWKWVAIRDVGEVTSGLAIGPSRRSADQAQVPYLRVANVQRGYLDLAEIRETTASEREMVGHRLHEGDILLAAGGDLDKLGRGWVWRSELQVCLHQNHVFRLRLAQQELRPEFISHFCNTFGAQWIESRASQATNLASIGIKVMREMPVPLPPISDMERIDDALRSALTEIDRRAAELDAAQAAASAARASGIEAAVNGREFAAHFKAHMIEAEVSREDETPFEQRDTRSGHESFVRHPTLESALSAADGWLDAQDAFARCGVTDGTETARIEALYAELRLLVADRRVEVLPETDIGGRKLFDRLRWERL